MKSSDSPDHGLRLTVYEENFADIQRRDFGHAAFQQGHIFLHFRREIGMPAGTGRDTGGESAC